MQEQIAALAGWIRQDLARTDMSVRLQSVPGIGPIPGMAILLESCAIERFASIGDYASYCRMVERMMIRLTSCCNTAYWDVDLNIHDLTDRRYFVAANGADAFVGESCSSMLSLYGDF